MSNSSFNSPLNLSLVKNILLICVFSSSNAANYTNIEVSEILAADKYVITQDIALAVISEQFPDISNKAQLARQIFHSSPLGIGHEGLAEAVNEITGGKRAEYLTPIRKQIKERIIATHPTKDYAVNLIERVSMPRIEAPDDFLVASSAEDIVATLLRFNKKYKEEPITEVLEGWTRNFNSRGDTKAKGLDISMVFPASWKPKQSRGPNTVRHFYSEAGHGTVSCNIIVRRVEPGSDLDKQEFFSIESIKDQAGGIGFEEILQYQKIVMAEEPAGFIVGDITHVNLDLKIFIRMTRYYVIIEDKLVMVDFMESSIEGEPSFSPKQRKEHQALFRIIASSFMNNKPFRN